MIDLCSINEVNKPKHPRRDYDRRNFICAGVIAQLNDGKKLGQIDVVELSNKFDEINIYCKSKNIV